MNYAIIKDNKVINRVVWDCASDWTYPFPHDEIREDEAGLLAIGAVWDGETWTIQVERIWHHLDYPMRIKAPLTLINTYPQLLFRLSVIQKLPIEQDGDFALIYCYKIDEEDQEVFNQLADLLTIEER